MTNITKQQFFHATSLLTEIMRFDQPADRYVADYFYNHRGELGAHDRHMVATIIFSALRHLEQWRALCGEGITPAQIIAITLLKVEGVPIDENIKHLKADDQTWLQGLATQVMPETLRFLSGLPQWIIDRLDYDEKNSIALGQSLMKSAPLDIRVNTAKMKREKALERLLKEGIAVDATPYSPIGLRFAHPYPIYQHPLFLDGTFEVQDEGSQLVGFLMNAKRGETVVDFCAGAGGKTLQLGAQMASTGRLYAWDISKARLANLTPRLIRSGLKNVITQWISGKEDDIHVQRLMHKVDRVLVDAPCSGVGTLRRHPDLRYRQGPHTLPLLTAQQASILKTASKLLKPKGRLVYATCSFLPEENEAIVNHFLANTADFSLEKAQTVLKEQRIMMNSDDYLRLMPHEHGTDGFFCCCIKEKLNSRLLFF